MIKSKKTKLEELYRDILFRDLDASGLKTYYDMNIDQIENILLSSAERKKLLLQEYTLLDMPRDLPRSCTTKFWDTDTEELYNKNVNKLGNDWIWATKPIEYSVNSLGYRMQEFNEIDWSNYLAVFGCSFTAGTGLPLEDTWSYRISKSLGLDLVNAAIPGGGNDTILINLTRLLKQKEKPKYIIISWSAITRKAYWYNGNVILYGSIDQKNKSWEQSYYNYLNNNYQWQYEFIEIKRQADTLCQLANVPVWHITNFNEYNFIDSVDKILPSQSDGSMYGINNWSARDYNFEKRTGHPGIELQDKIVDKWNQR